jgi:poly-gamma-glutamate synthesis protein (capsule biosynthesis protein)
MPRSSGFIWAGGLLLAVCIAFSLPALAHADESAAVPDPVRSLQSTETTASVESSLTLLAVGDLMCHDGQLSASRGSRGYDFTQSYGPVSGTIRSADVALGNLETTLGKGPPWAGYPRFRSPLAFASAIKSAGFDVLGTANNHSLDGGASGVRFTSAALGRLGIARVGTDNRRVAYVERNGIKLAFLAYTYGTNGIRSPFKGSVNLINRGQMRRDVAAAHKKADAVVMVLHWGTEYSATPEASTRRLGRAMVDAGADLVVGSHPHVVRPIEKYRDHFIVYSMGNFLSGQAQPMTDLGIMVKVKITKKNDSVTVSKLSVLPIYRDRTSGAGRRTYRALLIDRALAKKEMMVGSSDARTMRRYRAYCRRMFRKYY